MFETLHTFWRGVPAAGRGFITAIVFAMAGAFVFGQLGAFVGAQDAGEIIGVSVGLLGFLYKALKYGV